MSQREERVGDILRTYFGEVSSIPFRSYNGASYILEDDIEKYASINGITDVAIVQEAININNPRRFYTIINEESEAYYPITEAINLDALSNALHYGSFIGYANALTDQAAAAITGKKYNNVREIDDQIDRCKKCIRDIEEEKTRLRDNPKEVDSYKFTKDAGLLFARSLVGLFIGKGNILSKILHGWNAIMSANELVLSLVDYERLLNNLESSIETSISHLEKRRIKAVNQQEEMKAKKKEGKKK